MTLARLFAFGLFCAIALSGGALMAQDTAPQDPAQDAAPAEPSDLPLGEPAPAATGIYVAEVFGDWEKRCVRVQDGTDPCQLFQILRDGTGNPVAEFTIAPLPTPEGGAVAGGTIITPLETLLTGQLRLGIDGGDPKVYPFRFCREIGCYVRLGFTAEDIAAFKRGNAAQVTIVPLQAPDQVVTLTTSLSGFTAGYDNLDAEN